MKKNKKYRVLEELRNVPNIQLACERIGISRQTFYRWKEEDLSYSEEVDKALDFSREYVNDIAESQLMKGVKEGSFKHLVFWLSHNSNRYRNIKTHMPIKNNLPKIDIQEAAKVSEQNIIQSVQVGDIKSSKYILENNDPKYYSSTKARIKIAQDLRLEKENSGIVSEEKVQEMVNMMRRLCTEGDDPIET